MDIATKIQRATVDIEAVNPCLWIKNDSHGIKNKPLAIEVLPCMAMMITIILKT